MRVRTAILDNTGTLTRGHATVTDIKTSESFTADVLLRFAASLDQASGHVVASALIAQAVTRHLALSAPKAVTEVPGTGTEGSVDGTNVIVGGNSFVKTRSTKAAGDGLLTGVPKDAMTVAVAIDGALAGIIVL